MVVASCSSPVRLFQSLWLLLVVLFRGKLLLLDNHIYELVLLSLEQQTARVSCNISVASSVESMDLLVEKILSSYDKALLMLKFNVGATSGMPESPLSINCSPRSDDLDKDNRDTRDVSKKRNMLPRRTDQVRITSESRLEGAHDDGYSWRKYGQKDILGAKYPRSYYRCTYRNTQDCRARKQVQISDEDPTIVEVTYRGAHTCAHGNHAVPPPFSFPSTSFGLLKSENHSFSPSGVLDDNNILSSFSSPFMSPATSELNYFSALQSPVSNFGGIFSTQNSESDLKGLISANTSSTNSPIMDLDFSLDQMELDPNFQFDTPGLFS